MMTFKSMLHAAQHVVFLTGAGVSTASGIPDYRSKTGLYRQQANPEYLLSHTNLITNPASFYEFVTQQMYFPEANPNVIHQVMATIANQKGQIITQNVDGLHTKAGARDVIEFHGSLYRVSCQKCSQAVPYQAYLKDMHHQDCGGILRPNIVLYEEPIDPTVIERSIQAIEAADLIVVVGTSFRVYPFASLIEYRRPDAQLVAINQEALQFEMPVTMIQADATTVFAALATKE
ncbi:NAD-dependent protein deacylase [Latilactobacillus curvatus]